MLHTQDIVSGTVSDNPAPGSESSLDQQVLRTDVSGMPLEWVGYRDAVRLICLDQISYSLGRTVFRIRGGVNALTRVRSAIEVRASAPGLEGAAVTIEAV